VKGSPADRTPAQLAAEMRKEHFGTQNHENKTHA
jgi:hypothetical protein